MIPVVLTERELTQCRAWEKTILDTGLEQYENKTGMAPPKGRYYFGYMGELAFARWLTAERLRFEHRPAIATMSSKPPEFTLFKADGTELSGDVKAATEMFHKYFMFPADHEIKADIYVGVRIIDRHVVEVWGWLGRNDVAKLEVKEYGHGLTRSKPLEELRELADLHRRLTQCS